MKAMKFMKEEQRVQGSGFRKGAMHPALCFLQSA